MFSLLDVFGNTWIWKYLHTLHFSASNPINVKDLADVLRRHSETLQVLSLSPTSLCGGTCRDLLDFLKEQLRLTKFCPTFYKPNKTWCPYSAKDLDRMMAYVLHGGPAYPPTENELEEERLNSSDKVEAHGDEG
ncbi:hypothetical protein RUND412_005241 [Rhizina undulata]